MNPPLNLIDAAAWFAWSDYAQEQDSPKAAELGKRVGLAIQKLSSVGAEWGLYLVAPVYTRVYGRPQGRRARVVYLDIKRHPSLIEKLTTLITTRCDEVLVRNKAFWVTSRSLQKTHLLHPAILGVESVTPADFDCNRYSRLAWKFWRVTVRRATGVAGYKEIV